jgi:phospholipase C
MKGGLYYSAAALALIGSTPLAAAATQQQLAQQNIKHVVIIMQENRSFDHYFGTFPGADGIPAGTCVPIDPANPSAGCVQPYSTTSVNQTGAPHSYNSEVADVDSGRMDGFVAQQIQAFNAALARGRCTQPPNPQRPNPKCDGYYNHDVMSYYTAATLPNYWAYAQNFMLEDHLFEPSAGASLQAHLMMTSEWQAVCAQVTDPMSCTTTVVPVLPTAFNPTPYAWTNLTWLLNRAGVPWRYYLEFGAIPDCVSGFDDCAPGTQTTGTPSLWNPLPAFHDLRRRLQSQCRRCQPVLSRHQRRSLPFRCLDHAESDQFGTSRQLHGRRHALRHGHREHDHAVALLGLDRDLHRLG